MNVLAWRFRPCSADSGSGADFPGPPSGRRSPPPFRGAPLPPPGRLPPPDGRSFPPGGSPPPGRLLPDGRSFPPGGSLPPERLPPGGSLSPAGENVGGLCLPRAHPCPTAWPSGPTTVTHHRVAGCSPAAPTRSRVTSASSGPNAATSPGASENPSIVDKGTVTLISAARLPGGPPVVDWVTRRPAADPGGIPEAVHPVVPEKPSAAGRPPGVRCRAVRRRFTHWRSAREAFVRRGIAHRGFTHGMFTHGGFTRWRAACWGAADGRFTYGMFIRWRAARGMFTRWRAARWGAAEGRFTYGMFTRWRVIRWCRLLGLVVGLQRHAVPPEQKVEVGAGA